MSSGFRPAPTDHLRFADACRGDTCLAARRGFVVKCRREILQKAAFPPTEKIRGREHMELMVPLNVQGGSPLYEQIYQYIKKEIREGRLAAGSRLPSTRILA